MNTLTAFTHGDIKFKNKFLYAIISEYLCVVYNLSEQQVFLIYAVKCYYKCNSS